jgi:hypothetical protein
VTYELSIVASLCYPPQWGWATGDGDGQQGCWRSQLFGVPEWVPFTEVPPGLEPFDLAFAVYSEQAVPAMEASWGTIKHLYGFPRE